MVEHRRMQQLAPIRGSSALATPREQLKLHIDRLATEIGPRNMYHYSSLCRAAEYIEKAFCEAGYVPTRQTFEAKGKTFSNIMAEKQGTDLTGDIFVVGAHYDTHKDSPGANDNGSGIAALLDLARAVCGHPSRKSI